MKGSASPTGIKAVTLFNEIEIIVKYKTNIQSKLDTNTLITDKSNYVILVCWCLLISLLKAQWATLASQEMENHLSWHLSPTLLLTRVQGFFMFFGFCVFF